MAIDADALPSDDDQIQWFFTLYGLAMLSIQLLENSVSMLYLAANGDSKKRGSSSLNRELRVALDKGWRAFQKGSAGMKLNDAKVGVKGYLSPEVYGELDSFLSGPRNRLAHRYLLERLTEIKSEGPRQFFASAAELIEIHRQAKRLGEAVFSVALEFIESDDVEEPPENVQEWLDGLAQMVMLKSLPSDFLTRSARVDADQRSNAGD